jgi:ABC-type antimicrobial peptide transport system permease subunit
MASCKNSRSQFAADSVLLSFADAVLGVAMALIAIRALIAFLPHDTAANDLHASVDMRLLLFAFLVSLVTGFLAASAGYSDAEAMQLIRRISEGLRSSGSTQASSIARVQLLLGEAWDTP